MSKVLTILPPVRTEVARPKPVTVTVVTPGANTGGYLSSAYTTWRSGYTTRAVDALTKLNVSEAALFNAQTQVVESTIKKREALFKLQELPERLGHELAVRRVHRANELREVQHHYEKNEIRRMTEVRATQTLYLEADTAYTHALTDRTAARQRLRSQEEHGQLAFDIAHKKQNLELLNIELEERERRALMRKQLREIEDDEANKTDNAEYFEVDEEIDAMLRRSKVNR